MPSLIHGLPVESHHKDVQEGSQLGLEVRGNDGQLDWPPAPRVVYDLCHKQPFVLKNCTLDIWSMMHSSSTCPR